jgi:hypothetical protein
MSEATGEAAGPLSFGTSASVSEKGVSGRQNKPFSGCVGYGFEDEPIIEAGDLVGVWGSSQIEQRDIASTRDLVYLCLGATSCDATCSSELSFWHLLITRHQKTPVNLY